jgi:H+/Cl- antiporter ClcA
MKKEKPAQKIEPPSPKKFKNVVRNLYGSRLALIIESILIGFVSGFVVVFFRLSLNYVNKFRLNFYENFLHSSTGKIILTFLALIVIGLILGLINVFRPMVSGGGVSQIKGALDDNLRTDWKTELPLKFFASFLAIGAGFSFGWEGPSVMIGAYAGIAVLSVFLRPKNERKTLITSATAAGLSAAFNAPLAGVLFVVEELHASMAPLSIACAMGASMTADAVAGTFFGLTPIYNFRAINILPVNLFHWVILIGIICALVGDLFKRLLYGAQDLFDAMRIPTVFRPILPILLTVPLSIYLYDVTGGGHALIDSLTTENRPIQLLVIFLIVKLLYSAFCFGSGTSGGIFLPFIACGALTGDLFGKILTLGGFVTTDQQLNFMILAMAGMFSAVVKAPVTGIVLVLEMTGNYKHLASLVLVCLSAFVTAELINSRPIYDVLLDRILAKKNPKIFIEKNHDYGGG